jgi:cytochrome c peroxidase
VLAGQPPDPARTLDAREVAGLELFLSGRTVCLTCHHGPRFSDGQFHNIGTGELGRDGEDLGRFTGRELVRNSEFNCVSPFSDPEHPRDCRQIEGAFANEITRLVRGSFRTPGLRNLPATAPYFHDGRFASLEEVLGYYRTPPDKSAVFHELPKQLDLSDDEIANLASFLRALAAD